MQVAKNGPSEEELYEIYLQEGYDDITPFDGLTPDGVAEGRDLALAKWVSDNGQFGMGA